jgi:hypothetical protein
VDAVRITKDPRFVLEEGAIADVDSLLGSLSQPPDVQAMQAAGMLHWFRHLALEGEGEWDLLTALRCFAYVFEIEPAMVPDEVAEHFALHGAWNVVAENSLQLAQHAVSRAENSEDPDAISEAIRTVSQALLLLPNGHPRRPVAIALLSVAYRRSYERHGDLGDLDAAIATVEDTADDLPQDDAELPRLLYVLSQALLLHAEHTGSRADLNRAVDLARNVVKGEAPSDEVRADQLSWMAAALTSRFHRYGSWEDGEEAEAAAREAVSISEGWSGAERARYLSELTIVLREKFAVTGARATIDQAVTTARLTVSASPLNDVDRPRHLATLAVVLQERFARSGDMADLDAAILASQEAIASTPAGHADLPRLRTLLGGALLRRSEHTSFPLGGTADLVESIQEQRQAVRDVAADHPNRAAYLTNLSSALRVLHRYSNDDDLLDQAVDLARSAVDSEHKQYVFSATTRANLGSALLARYRRSSNSSDLAEARSVTQAAANQLGAPPSVRAAAAQTWGAAAAATGDWESAVEGFQTAIGMAALLVSRTAMRSDQEFWLSEMAGLGSQAAACCLQAGQPERAVELLEQGRGVLLGQALDIRTDLTEITERDPQLAAEFIRLRDQLDTVTATDITASTATLASSTVGLGQAEPPALIHDLDRRRQLADEFDKVVARIRAQPGFERFLLPLPIGQLLATADQGPVVLVNVAEIRSDALLLTLSGVRVVALPTLTPKLVYEQMVAFLDAIDEAQNPTAGPAERDRAEEKLTGILGWLWDSITGPVLEQLNITGPVEDAGSAGWPRLWWCPSGLLSFLPLHAAGHHATRFDSAPQTVLDRVVSSYTPTLRALTHARRLHPERAAEDKQAADSRLLVVAMPHTPDQPDLPGTVEEAALLRELFPDRILLHGQLEHDEALRLGLLTPGPAEVDATHEHVLAALPGSRWAHFACHAASDLTNPSASHLLLADHQTRPLTVLDLTRLRLADADLAFLSACATARPGPRLADEAIQLAAALQLAGYRHVIATLWPIADRPATRIATDVYKALLDHGAAAAAHALHHATRRRRNLNPDRSSTWAAHTHNGA